MVIKEEKVIKFYIEVDLDLEEGYIIEDLEIDDRNNYDEFF